MVSYLYSSAVYSIFLLFILGDYCYCFALGRSEHWHELAGIDGCPAVTPADDGRDAAAYAPQVAMPPVPGIAPAMAAMPPPMGFPPMIPPFSMPPPGFPPFKPVSQYINLITSFIDNYYYYKLSSRKFEAIDKCLHCI